MKTSDIVSEKYIVLVLIDLMGLFYGAVFTIRTKVGMIKQNYNVLDGVNYRADAKRFTHRPSCQFLDIAENNIFSKLLV